MINRIVSKLVGMWSRGDGNDTSSSSGKKERSGPAGTSAASAEQMIADMLIVEIILEYCYKVHRTIRNDRSRLERLYQNSDNIANIRALLISQHSMAKGYVMTLPPPSEAAASPSKSLAMTHSSFANSIAKTVYCPKCFMKVHGPRFASHLEACLKKDTGNVLLSSRLGGKGASDPYPKSSIIRIRLNAKGIPVRHQSRVGVDPAEWPALCGTTG